MSDFCIIHVAKLYSEYGLREHNILDPNQLTRIKYLTTL